MTRDEILHWLNADDPDQLNDLWSAADRMRSEQVGEAVHLRGLIEFANRCQRHCLYCGLRAPNHTVERYRLESDEILACAQVAKRRGYGTVVLQAGEDLSMTTDWLADVIARIKDETALAVTLSVGERPVADYARWRQAGADRYLLRFETSDRTLLRRLHPPRVESTAPTDRLALLVELKELGYEIGGGIMVGLPGQTRASVADDILLFGDLDLDMVGVGCFVPHPGTPLAEDAALGTADTGAARDNDQIPATALQTLKVVALTRLVRPDANIPSSTALATVAGEGHAAGLRCGANVIMPNLTPARCRALYDIYPTHLRDDREDEGELALSAIAACGRTVGTGPGNRGDR